MSLKKTDVRTPGIAAIAKKWNISVAKVSELVNIGAKVEFEHNKNINKARQVARDHINERPDYYQKLKKMEKTPVSMKEETGIGGVRGLGYTSGDPAGTDYVQQYINTNAMSYNDDNGSKLDYLKKKHIDLHNKGIGYDFFDPTKIKSSSNFMKEESINELGGMTGYEGISGPIRPLRKNDQLEEGPLKDKAKKVAMAGITAANMYTLADVAGRATEGGHGSPKGDIVRAASTLPGAAGWGATAVHYGKKGYDLARDALKKKKAKMEEEKKMPNPCWKGYKAYGMKKKDGKEVPNCVPVEEQNKYPQTTQRGIYEGDDREVVYTHKKGPLYGTVTQHSDGTISSRRKVGMFWRGRTHSSKEAAIAHLENDGKKKKLREERIDEKAPPGAKYERMVRHIKDKLGADGLTDKEKGIAFATAWKAYNKKHIKEDGFDLDAVTNAIRSKESRNDYGAKSKSSSASGAYQYINKTWKGSASKYGVDTKQFPTAKSAPKEVQDKVFTNDLQKNASKYGSLEKAVNVHYTGNPGGKVSSAGLKANRGQTGGGYMDDIKKRVDDYNTERKSTMGAAQQMAANFSGGSKSLSTPDSTQFAKADTPKPTQVASAPETPKMQNPDQNITKVASAPAPTQVSQLDTKDKQKVAESAAWQRKEGKNPEGGLNRKGIASYRRENPGSKLSMAVTTKPSKLKPGSKAANRRKSFCARMGGMPGPMKDEKGRPTRKALSLRKWNCEESVVNEVSAEKVGKVHLRYLEKNKPVPPFVSRAVVKKWLESKVGRPPEKEKKQVKENSRDKDHDMVSGFNEQHHIYLNKTGMTHTLKEETTMDNNNLINEAIENILDNNLNEMKENLMDALQEKAQEKLEERKKLIASQYFAQ